MERDFRAFYHKFGVNPSAISSALIETVQTTSRKDFEGERATKVICSIFGPMQKLKDASGVGSEACSVKVTIEFDDLMRSEQILLEQYPAVEEDLEMQLDQAGTKAASDSIREKRLKAITHNVQAELQKTLQSCILTESYPATTIAFNF